MSEETTYTPSPWQIDNGEGYSIWGVRIDGRLIAQVVGDDAESEANAHLIGAAPELLEALMDLLRYGMGRGDCREKAQAAVAKAMGGK